MTKATLEELIQHHTAIKSKLVHAITMERSKNIAPMDEEMSQIYDSLLKYDVNDLNTFKHKYAYLLEDLSALFDETELIMNVKSRLVSDIEHLS